MFRLSQYMKALRRAVEGAQQDSGQGSTRRNARGQEQGKEQGRARGDAPRPPVGASPLLTKSGPVVIWNLIRRCNLRCKHCYSISGDVDFPGELNFDQVCAVMDDLAAFEVPVLILSGGEPLLRPDIFDISRRARGLGFYVGLSTNGVLIDERMAEAVAGIGYDYVGISLDGIGAVHDGFRGMKGAFRASLDALRLCRDAGVKTGVRFTMTADNAHQFDDMIALTRDEGFGKFYFSHLVYAGRGNKNRGDDAALEQTRAVMEHLFEIAWAEAGRANGVEFVTGNNDADAVFLLKWVERAYPEHAPMLHRMLSRWGGNQSGVRIANIDNIGDVHPDTMWWHHTIGNVKERPFSEIWGRAHETDEIMAGLRQRPRPVKGRCGACRYLDICNGNARVRAWRIAGDVWAEDPACYLTDAEIGVESPQPRLRTTPFRGARKREGIGQ